MRIEVANNNTTENNVIQSMFFGFVLSTSAPFGYDNIHINDSTKCKHITSFLHPVIWIMVPCNFVRTFVMFIYFNDRTFEMYRSSSTLRNQNKNTLWWRIYNEKTKKNDHTLQHTAAHSYVKLIMMTQKKYCATTTKCFMIKCSFCLLIKMRKLLFKKNARKIQTLKYLNYFHVEQQMNLLAVYLSNKPKEPLIKSTLKLLNRKSYGDVCSEKTFAYFQIYINPYVASMYSFLH